VSFKRILCDREEQAEEAYQALEGGLDFTSAITQYSKADDAKEGGTVITAPFGQLLPELEDPVFNLKVGEYTEPIFTAQGWVIIQVIKIDKSEKQKVPLEEVKERLRQTIASQRETCWSARTRKSCATSTA
jgi:parvulin-like peptidyl-prolyl isomerase